MAGIPMMNQTNFDSLFQSVAPRSERSASPLAPRHNYGPPFGDHLAHAREAPRDAPANKAKPQPVSGNSPQPEGKQRVQENNKEDRPATGTQTGTQTQSEKAAKPAKPGREPASNEKSVAATPERPPEEQRVSIDAVALEEASTQETAPDESEKDLPAAKEAEAIESAAAAQIVNAVPVDQTDAATAVADAQPTEAATEEAKQVDVPVVRESTGEQHGSAQKKSRQTAPIQPNPKPALNTNHGKESKPVVTPTRAEQINDVDLKVPHIAPAERVENVEKIAEAIEARKSTAATTRAHQSESEPASDPPATRRQAGDATRSGSPVGTVNEGTAPAAKREKTASAKRRAVAGVKKAEESPEKFRPRSEARAETTTSPVVPIVSGQASHSTTTTEILAEAKDKSAKPTPAKDEAVVQSLARSHRTSGALGRGSRAASDEGAPQVDAARFVGRVAKAIQTAHQRGGALQLRLSPPELGALRLELTVQDGVMTARLEADSATARQVLLDHLPVLRDRLAEQNIRIERFDVDVRQEGSGSQADARASQHERQQQQPHDASPRHAANRPHVKESAPQKAPPPNATTTDTCINVLA